MNCCVRLSCCFSTSFSANMAGLYAVRAATPASGQLSAPALSPHPTPWVALHPHPSAVAGCPLLVLPPPEAAAASPRYVPFSSVVDELRSLTCVWVSHTRPLGTTGSLNLSVQHEGGRPGHGSPGSAASWCGSNSPELYTSK